MLGETLSRIIYFIFQVLDNSELSLALDQYLSAISVKRDIYQLGALIVGNFPLNIIIRIWYLYATIHGYQLELATHRLL